MCLLESVAIHSITLTLDNVHRSILDDGDLLRRATLNDPLFATCCSHCFLFSSSGLS